MYNEGSNRSSKTVNCGGNDLSITAEIQKIDCNSESDADLLTLISWREEDENEARRALGEFYNRHFKLLAWGCMKKYGRQIGEQGVEDLVNDTFMKVFKTAASKFKTDEKDPKKLQHLIGAWLGGIAYNLFIERLQKRKRLPEFQVEDDFDPHDEDGFIPEDIDFVPLDENPMPPERIEQYKRLRPVLDGLIDRERIILLTRFKNYHFSDGKQQFHPDDLERLTNDLELTKDHVRQIFNRTLQKVKKQLS